MAEKRPSELLDPLDAHRRLTTKEVMALIGVKSKNTLWKRVREGKLPRPRYQVARQPRWVLGEVLDALDAREGVAAHASATHAKSAPTVTGILARLGLHG